MLALRPLARVLVTGGAGFIGSTLVRQLLARQATQVLTYDALTYAGLRESLPDDPEQEFVQGNVTDAKLLAATIAKFRPDTVLHLAAESHVDRSIASPEAFVRTNVEGTATLLRVWREHVEQLSDAEQQAALLVHVSTDEVYGSMPAGQVAREGDPYLPSSPYSATKAAADHLVHAYRRTYGQQSIIVCPTNNYGPRQFPEKLIPLATLRALRNESVPLYGDGLQVRDWLHVDDCAAGLVAIAERGAPGETYHLGFSLGVGSDEWANRRIVETICDAVDELRPGSRSRRALIETVADRPGHDRRYALDSSKVRRRLGWKPKQDLAAGIRATVAWYLENSDWVAAAEARA